jgi:hypothetical protein
MERRPCGPAKGGRITQTTREVIRNAPSNIRRNYPNVLIGLGTGIATGVVGALIVKAGWVKPRTVVLATTIVGGGGALLSAPGTKKQAAFLGAAIGGAFGGGAAAVGAWQEHKARKDAEKAGATPPALPAPGGGRNAAVPPDVRAAIEQARELEEARMRAAMQHEYAGMPPDGVNGAM